LVLLSGIDVLFVVIVLSSGIGVLVVVIVVLLSGLAVLVVVIVVLLSGIGVLVVVIVALLSGIGVLVVVIVVILKLSGIGVLVVVIVVILSFISVLLAVIVLYSVLCVLIIVLVSGLVEGVTSVVGSDITGRVAVSSDVENGAVVVCEVSNVDFVDIVDDRSSSSLITPIVSVCRYGSVVVSGMCTKIRLIVFVSWVVGFN
jgi:hypothetical protein